MRRPGPSRGTGSPCGPGPACRSPQLKTLRREAAGNKAQRLAASAGSGASRTSFSNLVAGESRSAGVAGRRAELLFDAQQLVVFGDAVGAGGAAGLDLARAHANG